MKIYEAKQSEGITFSDIFEDYITLAEFYELKAEAPEATVFFDKSGKITSIDPVSILIACPPPQRGMRDKPYVTVNYTCTDYDGSVTLDNLDGTYEAQEVDDGYMITTEDLDSLSVLNAVFEKEIIWPYDNASVHDSVNRELSWRKDDEKIKWYVTDGIAKTDAYKALEKESQSEMAAAQKVRKVRAGRTNNEILRDALNATPGIAKIETIDKGKGRYVVAYRIHTKTGKIYDILCNKSGTEYLVKNFGEFGNSVKTGSYEQVVKVVKQRIGAEIERGKTNKMSARDKYFYNKAKLDSKSADDSLDAEGDWGSDMDTAEEEALGIKEESFRKYLADEQRKNRLYEAMKLMRINGYSVLREAGSFKEFCNNDDKVCKATAALEQAKQAVDVAKAKAQKLMYELTDVMYYDDDEDIAEELRALYHEAKDEWKAAQAAHKSAAEDYNVAIADARSRYDRDIQK